MRQDWRSSWSWVLLPPPPPSNWRGCGWRTAKNPSRNSSSNNITYSIGKKFKLRNKSSTISNLKLQNSPKSIFLKGGITEIFWRKELQKTSSTYSTICVHRKLWWFWNFNKKTAKIDNLLSKNTFLDFLGALHPVPTIHIPTLKHTHITLIIQNILSNYLHTSTNQPIKIITINKLHKYKHILIAPWLSGYVARWNWTTKHIQIIITSVQEAYNVIPTLEPFTNILERIKTDGNIMIHCTCAFCVRSRINQPYSLEFDWESLSPYSKRKEKERTFGARII